MANGKRFRNSLLPFCFSQTYHMPTSRLVVYTVPALLIDCYAVRVIVTTFSFKRVGAVGC